MNHKALEYLNKFSMMFITIMILANLFIYKTCSIWNYTISVGSLIVPFWFIINNIVTEVYGYKTCRNLINNVLVFSLIFTIFAYLLINIPSTGHDIIIQHHYEYVMGDLPRVYFVSVLGIFLGSIVDSICISKLKAFLNGQYLWARFLSAGIFGEIVFTVVTIFFDMISKFPLRFIIHAILYSILIKFIITLLFSKPICFIIEYLKVKLKTDVFDYGANYNIFKR
jgi:uncharacterized integral membrane protein (TIGR00697 family)